MKIMAGLVMATLLVLAFLYPRARAAEEKKDAKSTSGLHEITLPAMQVELPPGPGRDTVAATCVICHSNRYITMQPAFSKTVWTAEVEKMRKVFGAPLTNDQAAQAVDYLVAIRGATTPTPRP